MNAIGRGAGQSISWDLQAGHDIDSDEDRQVCVWRNEEKSDLR